MPKNNPIRCIAPVLLLCAAGLAQDQGGPLKVVVIEGDGVFNDVQRKTAHAPVVEVRDELDRPVPEARVVFTLPTTGPGGSFPGNRKELIATTDEQGRAAARGLAPNSSEGRFPIRVTASTDGRRGSTVIWQSNTLAAGDPKPSSRRKKYIILGLIGGAVAGGAAIVASRGNGSGSGAGAAGPIPTTLSAGTVTIGGPR